MISITTLDKIQLKFDRFDGNTVNGIRRFLLTSFAISVGPRPEVKRYKKTTKV